MTNALPQPKIAKVGAAQEVITPPIVTSLAGYFHDRVAERVRDDVFARAVVIEADRARVAVVSCDLICVTAEIVDGARTIIEEKCGIPRDHILICATHTHTGPEVRPSGVVPICQPWLEALPGRIASAVQRAAESAVPATLRAGRTNVEGYSFNRLYRLRDGSELFGKRGREPEIIGAAGPIDPELQALSAVAEDGRLVALMVNFACHPDVIGGGGANFISADWPGVMADTIASVYGHNVVTLHLQGTCGDINHVVHEPSSLPRSGPDKAVQMGRGLAGATITALERAEPATEAKIDAVLETVPIPYYTREKQMEAEVAALRAKDHRRDQEDYIIERFDAWPHDGKTADVPVHAIRIGDVALLGLPAEIFVRIGLEIKHWSPAAFTLVVELANARVSSYVPTTDQAARGAYGARPILSRWLCADAGRRLADAAQVALCRLYQGE